MLAPGRGTQGLMTKNVLPFPSQRRELPVWPGLGTWGGAIIGNWVSLGSWAWGKDVDEARNRAEGGGCGEAPPPPLPGVGRYAPCTTSRPWAVLLTLVPGLLAAQT